MRSGSSNTLLLFLKADLVWRNTYFQCGAGADGQRVKKGGNRGE